MTRRVPRPLAETISKGLVAHMRCESISIFEVHILERVPVQFR